MSEPDPKSPMWRALHVTYTSARRIIIGVVGATVVAVGICMLVLPGPAFVVIPAGLAILGAEFAFAQRWLHVLKEQARNGLNAVGLGTLSARSAANNTPPHQRNGRPVAPPANGESVAGDSIDRTLH